MKRALTKISTTGVLCFAVLTTTPLNNAIAAKISPMTFTVAVPGIGSSNLLPRANTCDGASASPALTFTGVPKSAKSIAVIMHGIPGPARPGETEPSTHVYWTLYNLPVTTKVINQGSTGGGLIGHNFKDNNLAYTPPCSQGPGLKQYTITAYALKSAISLTPSAATRDSLLNAMAPITLATSTLNLNYERAS